MYKLLARLIMGYSDVLVVLPTRIGIYCLLKLMFVEFTIIVYITRKSYYRVLGYFNYLLHSVLLFIGISVVLFLFAVMFWLWFV